MGVPRLPADRPYRGGKQRGKPSNPEQRSRYTKNYQNKQTAEQLELQRFNKIMQSWGIISASSRED